MFFSIRCSFSLCAGHGPKSGPVFCHHGVSRVLGRNNDAAEAVSAEGWVDERRDF